MDEKTTKTNRRGPVVLIVLDGWGVDQPYSGNAVAQAKTPVFSKLVASYPATTVRASGEAVGLPWGENGNSEVGHMNLGLGRIFYQDLPRINKSISDGSFYLNSELLKAIEHCKKNNSKLHLMGLVSNGCVHASFDHLVSLLSMAKNNGLNNIFVHAFLDGRDTPYNSGINFIKELERNMTDIGVGKIATLSGRFYAMDRDNHWERISRAYLAMTNGEGEKNDNPIQAIQASYEKKIYDEEFSPTVITENGQPRAVIEKNDSVIFFNFRADRAREITKCFILPGFNKFEGWNYIENLSFTCFTEYEKDLPAAIAFPPEAMINGLSEVISKAGLKQLHIAETEKYAHVSYFFNGGNEEKNPGEEDVLVPSPRVESYDLKPEMSANEVTEIILKSIHDDVYDFILVNYANADMVGHTGNLKATVKAIEAADKCLGRLVDAILKAGGVAVITADHGNAENKFNMQTGMINKEHTNNPVPLIIVGNDFEGRNMMGQEAVAGDLSLIQPQGILSDIAPTILKIMGLEKPKEMTGRSLI